MRILVVEDEQDLCGIIAEGLELNGYAVDQCYDGTGAYELICVERYDLVVLDLNLPGMDGLDVLRKVRAQDQDTKFLILSARASVADKVTGLDEGPMTIWPSPSPLRSWRPGYAIFCAAALFRRNRCWPGAPSPWTPPPGQRPWTARL